VSARHALLLVEDNPSIARVYLEYLRRGPYDTTQCETGAAALAALAARNFAVILLDLHLPDMAGIEILKRLTAAGTASVVIVITANGSINTAVEAMREGAADFLVKPFTPERLLATIGHALERRTPKPIVHMECDLIKSALERSGGNISRAAALLGIDPSTLFRKMQIKELVR
jgi:two-component system repressor protein LuxO